MNIQTPKQNRRRIKLFWIVVGIVLGALALLFWPNTVTMEADIFVPIETDSIPSGLTLTEAPLKGVEVKISGPAAEIKTLQQQQLKYSLDLSDLTTGYQHLPLKKEGLKLPAGVSILQLTPSHIGLSVENRLKKTVPILVVMSGKPVKGYQVMNIVATPASVELCGPESTLKIIEFVKTKPIDLTGRKDSFKKEVVPDLPENIKMISPPEIFFAELLLDEIQTTRSFSGITVNGKGTNYRYQISPDTIRIEVKGPANTLETLDRAKSIAVHVDLKGLAPGVYVRRAIISLPLKTILTGVSPEVFTVKITKR